MAEAGTEVGFTATVRADPIQVAQLLTQSLPSTGNYLDDTQVVPVGPTTFRVTRRYLPQWALICGIIGLFLCLIGLAAVFFRDTEVLTIDIVADREGARVTVSGKAKADFVTTLQSTLARFEGYSPEALPFPGIAASGQFGASGVTETQFSPDGYYWWDGAAWQPVTRVAGDVDQDAGSGPEWT